MTRMPFKKQNREAARKAKQQRNQQRKLERRKTAPEALSKPGAAEFISPLQNSEGAIEPAN